MQDTLDSAALEAVRPSAAFVHLAKRRRHAEHNGHSADQLDRLYAFKCAYEGYTRHSQQADLCPRRPRQAGVRRSAGERDRLPGCRRFGLGRAPEHGQGE